MKLTVIAARLRQLAVNLEVAAAQTDYDFPDQMVTRLITNAFTDNDALRVFTNHKRRSTFEFSQGSPLLVGVPHFHNFGLHTLRENG
jgi:hypothetical protein